MICAAFGTGCEPAGPPRAVIFAEALRRGRIAAVHMTFTRRKPTLGSALSGNNFTRAGDR
jgi:hypothetical protein